MNTRKFLETIWGDAEGHFCITTPFQTADMAKPAYRHHVYPTMDEAIRFAKAEAGAKDIFFAIHTLKQPKMFDPAKFNRKTGELGADAVRIQPNMQQARALFFDLDVGSEDKKYHTRAEALNDLQRFLFLTGLPDPLVTSSGGGFHVYWLLKQHILSPKWKVLAAKLHSIALHLGMKHDPMRTTDVSSVLRVAGTFNHKNKLKPRPVVVLHEGEISENKVFRARIEALVADNNVSLIPAAKGTGKPFQPPVANIPGNLGSTDTLYSGIVTPLRGAYKACGQLRRYIKNQGKASEPLWYYMLGLIRPMKHGDKLVHTLSSKHPGYNYAATEQKLRQYQLKTGFQPPSCTSIERVSGNKACQKCPFYGKAKNPLMAANNVFLATPPKVEVNDPVPFDVPPKPYKIGEGIIMDKVVDKIASSEKISDYIMFPYEDYDKTGGEPAFSLWYARLPTKNWISFRVDRSMYSKPNEMLPALGGEGLFFTSKHHKSVMDFMTAYIKKLQEHQRANKQYAHLGWTEERTKFIMADTVLSNDGTSRAVVLSERAKPALAWVKRAGDRQLQINAMQFYNDDKYIPHQFAVLNSLGSVLMAATEYGGIVLSLAGSTSGSKSTSLYAGGSFWGPPKEYVLDSTSNGSTVGGRIERMATLSNLPIMLDEMTHISVEHARDFVMGVSEFKDKVRLNNRGIQIPGRVEDKAMVAIVTTNQSLHQLISQNNRAGTAGTVRIFEIPMTTVGVADKQAADQFRYALQKNYGHIGHEFVEYIITRWPKIEQRVRALEAQLFTLWNMETPERYYAAMAAAAIVAGQIAVKLGLLPFDLTKILDWLTDVQIPYLQGVIKIASLEIDPVTVMSNYISHINGDTLFVDDGTVSNNSVAHFEGNYAPRDIKAHYDINGKKLWLRKNAFREYCDRIGRNALNIIETLTKSGLIQADKKFQLGKGTKVDMGSRPPCIMLDMTHKTMAGSQPTPPSTPHPPTATQNV